MLAPATGLVYGAFRSRLARGRSGLGLALLSLWGLISGRWLVPGRLVLRWWRLMPLLGWSALLLRGSTLIRGRLAALSWRLLLRWRSIPGRRGLRLPVSMLV